MSRSLLSVLLLVLSGCGEFATEPGDHEPQHLDDSSADGTSLADDPVRLGTAALFATLEDQELSEEEIYAELVERLAERLKRDDEFLEQVTGPQGPPGPPGVAEPPVPVEPSDDQVPVLPPLVETSLIVSDLVYLNQVTGSFDLQVKVVVSNFGQEPRDGMICLYRVYSEDKEPIGAGMQDLPTTVPLLEGESASQVLTLVNDSVQEGIAGVRLQVTSGDYISEPVYFKVVATGPHTARFDQVDSLADDPG